MPVIEAARSTGHSSQPLEEVVVAGRVRTAPLVVVQTGIDDRPHHAQGEGGVGAGHGPQVLVGDTGGPAPERVDDHELGAVALAGLEDEAPQVRRGRERVPRPHDHVAGVRPPLGVDLG